MNRNTTSFRHACGATPKLRVAIAARAALVAAPALLVLIACQPAAVDAPPARQLRRLADVVLAPDSEIRQALVPQRTTIAGLLEAHQLLADEIVAIVASMGEKFDLRRIRAGQPYRLDRFFDGRIREFEYEVDHDRRVIVRRQDASDTVLFAAELAPIEKTVEEIIVTGAIGPESPSLVRALDAAGERIELSLSLADIFSGEVDFNSDLQPGDSFRLVVERGTRSDGRFAGYGPVLVAELVNDGRRLQAVRFTPPDGKPGYFDSEGRSLKRFFLKSPLKFEPRVTSAFSRSRRHPILNYTRAHNGVDYAAPPGAPVVAVAGGVVTLAGWTGGGGRTVRVRHASGYASEYLHLSAIAAGIRSGVRVGQGELIGRVGSSGLATGPHLHYGLRRNGAYVNPVREHRNMPPGDPVAAVHLAIFALERDRLMLRLGDGGARAVN
jgi:murein DD-endopeptidase MepM/ murein hydrolase activator NlpD